MPINEAVLAEISREVPESFNASDTREFVMVVYGCTVVQDYIHDNRFDYTAINIETGKSMLIDRRRTPLPDDENKVVKLALKVRDSRVSGLGRLEVAEGVPLSKLRAIVQELFRVILPMYDKYQIREEQIALAEELLEALAGRKTLLAEAPTGLGKTLVYIIIGLLVRRSGLNKTMSGGYFLGMSCVEWLRMGVLVSTSSIALQKAIVSEVIPELSEIFMDWGIIREPITAVLRKGKEHYICEYNLREYLQFAEDDAVRAELERLVIYGNVIDLGEVDSLTGHTKSKIHVPSKCYKNCPYPDVCRYRAFRNTAKNTGYDFVITNHQLLLADMRLRSEESGAVLPPFNALVLDEAHKVLPAARSLFGSELPADAIPAITKALLELNFTPKIPPKTDGWKIIRDTVCKTSGKLYEANKRLFSRSDAGEQCDKTLRHIRDFADLLHKHLSVSHEFKTLRDERLKHSLLWELQRVSKIANELFDSNGMIRWFVKEKGERAAIGGIPKDLNERLYADLWKRGIPAMLTSGTLSVGGDFTALKQSLGLDNKNIRLAEATHDSPFNYAENCLLYLSENVPDYRAKDYIAKLTDEIELLIKASHGHAAILFTSFKTMRVVHGRLKKRMPDMKAFMLERGSSTAIEQFKASGNDVLFACGSMWEGIDCPGDILSLLVIAKLPFAQPDAISEFEQTRYPNFGAYFDAVLLPDMLIKTKQGHGRGFRTEDDTCVVAICDCRALSDYYDPLIAALPKSPVTKCIGDVEEFYRKHKTPEYFNGFVPSWDKAAKGGI